MLRRHAGLWAAVVLGGLVVGCSSYEAQPTAVQSAGKMCLSTSADIGPDGGTMSLGPYTLTIPAGALAYTTQISISQETCGAWPVRLEPDGTQFAVPATLEFDASSEPDHATMQVAWWNPALGSWLPQATMHKGALLSSQISHFSKWIIH